MSRKRKRLAAGESSATPDSPSQEDRDRARTVRRDRTVIVRDLIIFQLKLLLDGMKDLVLSPLSIVAAVIDFVFPTKRRGRRFYAVLMLGERFDRWLSLFSASEKAAMHEQGLFGASRAGTNTMLGKLEELVIGRTEDEPAAPEPDELEPRQ